MPNTNVRAAAEGLPAINRRRMLLGLAAASTAAAAITAASAAGCASVENPELVRLGNRLPEAAAEYRAALEEIEWIAAEWKHRWPLAPDEITLARGSYTDAERDIVGRLLKRPGEEQARCVRDVENLTAILGWDRPLRKNASEGMRARRADWLVRRKHELKLGKAYHAETARLRKASGIELAKARAAAAKKSLSDLVTAIMEQPGTTMEGMLIKAQAVATFNKAIARKYPFEAELWAAQLAASVLQLASAGDASA
ncbi:hypothetical protein [Mesorhizobium sp.]|uniref:hypothetical protein n=3 Tax=Mesorhizobium sp. TaxID=1871066 RepID=UPI000FE7CBAA|nr:hypothetical protein [Mesorhizobium sp.]RWO57433.1 MAG: hypothetical protein EOS14_22560 [Mesorhizobium sp.]RWO75945.1 MAG: hypothetical protein EOS18_28120 [Mesorhizobium sp.]TIL29927.1 MAG: hypothetical protein E5Y85_26425 [Mesorhizobium sp.]TIL48431.1 MAG: hypothetical protein E5Y83_31375 [Mesorhizobium sp.]TIM04372.1 MAG: hypothetical protein E5Y67_33460 [Mesorhizobium sp.]